jgi:uncharacterized protein YfaP (DUF2135 family)
MNRRLTLSLLLSLGLFGCGQESPEATQLNIASSEQSDLRFHVNFNKFLSNDLDIHVIEPSGTHLSFTHPNSDSGGLLKHNCSCSECPTHGSEMILWPKNQQVKGVYEIWVEVSGNCSSEVVESEFTLSVLEGNQVKASLEGKLSQGQSQVLYYEFRREN